MMARFIGYVRGNRGEASRTAGSGGLQAQAQGWDIGARVSVFEGYEGEDVISLELFGGSNLNGQKHFLGQFRKDPVSGLW